MISKRPNLSAYFRGRIDWHVNGLRSTARLSLPREVVKVSGDVTDPVIVVTMRDGSVWHWAGGRYATRKINGCYAPLMPRPITGEDA